jgi:hypothetical protein
MIKEKLVEEMKKALKEKNFIRLDTLRLTLAEIKYKEIEKRSELDEGEIIALLKREVKKREESLVFFEKGNRPELIQRAHTEISVLNEFLPSQLSLKEVEALVDEIVSSLKENKGFGQIMKEVMTRVAGRADGKVVSAIVKHKLNAG